MFFGIGHYQRKRELSIKHQPSQLAEGEKFMICQCFSWCQQQRHHDQSSSDKICLANTVFVTHGESKLNLFLGLAQLKFQPIC
ncbi:hypothetical protein ES319_1Z206500v1 [Gossypium barbadense]|uniref:Uncharacterized protein n=2 Tax=Gossypium TaxID=3633 RepID=A0A5J5NC94_GOSBA|nr:hypothetical protein ES319_1Z206500v1 [Gossypium barbadense]TYH20455.1 hypothetical protein ES288_A05G430900v1 [Gossypium darwinii]